MITDEQVMKACDAYDEYNVDHNNTLLRGVCSGHAMRNAIEAYEQSKWVSVNDRLPPLYDLVLAYRPKAHLSDDPHYKITFLTDSEQTSPTNVKHCWDCWCEVSHWQTLPEFKE